jgi:hypothetical protein
LMLLELGCYRLKIASTGYVPTLINHEATIIKSWPWGRKSEAHYPWVEANLTAIPLYPTPLEALYAAPLLDGLSDHCEGIAACQYAIARGAKIVEVHFALPGRSRYLKFDKTPEMLREIRDFADKIQTITTGIATHFRERWNGR